MANFFMRRIFRTSKYPYGQIYFGEISLWLNFLTAKFPYSEISYALIFHGENSYGGISGHRILRCSSNFGVFDLQNFISYVRKIDLVTPSRSEYCYKVYEAGSFSQVTPQPCKHYVCKIFFFNIYRITFSIQLSFRSG